MWLVHTDSFGCVVGGCESVGINEISNANNQLIIYPNPTNSSLTIASHQTLASITVYDMVGKEMLHVVIHKNIANINIAAYANGLYFMKAVDENGEVFTQKMVKE